LKKAVEKKYRSRQEAVVKAERLTEKITKKLEISEPERVDICIAVTEAVNNAVEHGNQLMQDKYVTLLFEYSDERLRITIRDEGEGFDLEAVENPLSPENLTKPNGRGLLIVESLMDDVEVSPSATGTEVVMVKKR
jgi:serine/threonine-protein kinase RsbW